MSDNLPRMDYRQHRRARRLVHECCNYDGGNCLLLDDGEPCVCVQSISLSLMCRWFRVAVLPLDGGAGRSPFVPGEPETVCGLRRGICPQIQPGKILPRLRRTHEENQSRREKAETKAEMSRFRAFQTRINQGFFARPQRGLDTFILFPRKRRSKCVQTPQIHPKEEPCQTTENTTTSS